MAFNPLSITKCGAPHRDVSGQGWGLGQPHSTHCQFGTKSHRMGMRPVLFSLLGFDGREIGEVCANDGILSALGFISAVERVSLLYSCHVM